MISNHAIESALDDLATMPFFPAGLGPRTKIGEEIEALCSTDEQALWLGHRVATLYAKWPGLHELRAVLCSKFRPRSGKDISSLDERYLDGFPSETKEPDHKLLSAGERKQLAAETGLDREAAALGVPVEQLAAAQAQANQGLVKGLAGNFSMPRVLASERRTTKEKLAEVTSGR